MKAAAVLKPARHELGKATSHIQLRVPHPDLSDPQRLCHNVAASCLRCGIETTGKLSGYLVPEPLDPEDGESLLTYAAVQWIKPESVLALQKLMDAGCGAAPPPRGASSGCPKRRPGAKLIVLDTERAKTGWWYLQRLYVTAPDYEPGMVSLPAIPCDAPDVVRADLRKALRSKLRNCPDDNLDELIPDLEPITVVLDRIPSDEVVDVIGQVLGDVAHAILAVVPARALPHGGTLVNPGPDPVTEQLQHKAHRKATNRLHAKIAGGAM